jgi:hypothetical protein
VYEVTAPPALVGLFGAICTPFVYTAVAVE